MWNGINYILKMPSDLDYLAEYLAIKRWVGFPLIRNPFCVPYPLEEGQELLNGAINDINDTIASILCIRQPSNCTFFA